MYRTLVEAARYVPPGSERFGQGESAASTTTEEGRGGRRWRVGRHVCMTGEFSTRERRGDPGTTYCMRNRYRLKDQRGRIAARRPFAINPQPW